MKYFLLTDEATQWYSYIIVLGGRGETISIYSLNNNITGTFLKSIFSREPAAARNFDLLTGGGMTFCSGWTLSEYEYNRLLTLINLYPNYKKYLSLIDISNES